MSPCKGKTSSPCEEGPYLLSERDFVSSLGGRAILLDFWIFLKAHKKSADEKHQRKIHEIDASDGLPENSILVLHSTIAIFEVFQNQLSLQKNASLPFRRLA